jgi:hypothetical protein
MISLLIIVALLLVLGFGLGLVRTRQRALSGREAAGRVDAGSGEERSATTKEAEAVAAPPEEPAAALPSEAGEKSVI